MEDLKKKITGFDLVPNLAIISIGDSQDSDVYVQRKIAFAKKIGANAYVVNFSKGKITQEKLLAEIEKLNKDESVNGIIIQSPLPKPLDWFEAVKNISSTKDVDGVSPSNVENLLANNNQGLIPATAKGILTLLNYYQIPVRGKKVVVMGRSFLVGRPIANLMMNNGATVTVVHSKTVNPEKETREADILIVAIGQPKLIGKNYIKAGQVVVDVGITAFNRPAPHHLPVLNTTAPASESHPALTKVGISGKPLVTVVGDVDFDSVKEIVSAISPVPGGVGPMTVASLFQNLVEAYEGQNNM